MEEGTTKNDAVCACFEKVPQKPIGVMARNGVDARRVVVRNGWFIRGHKEAKGCLGLTVADATCR